MFTTTASCESSTRTITPRAAARHQAAAHGVFDFLATGAHTRSNRHGRGPLVFGLGQQQATQYREPARLHLSFAGQALGFGLHIETMVNVGYRLLTSKTLEKDSPAAAVNREFR